MKEIFISCTGILLEKVKLFVMDVRYDAPRGCYGDLFRPKKRENLNGEFLYLILKFARSNHNS